MLIFRAGQVMVLTLITLTVVLLTTLIVFNITQLTTEKERLQNTADAVTYSIAVVEGRDLNFGAYTNRAMAANQVAIAQFMGLVSWVRYLYQMSHNLALTGKVLQAIGVIPGLQVIGAIGKALKTVFGQIENFLKNTAMGPFEKVVGFLISGLNIIMKFLSYAQVIFHYASIETAVQTLFAVLNDNDPDASISSLGVATLALHEKNWLLDFTQWRTGDKRFADVVMESRDPWTENRGYSFALFCIGGSSDCGKYFEGNPAYDSRNVAIIKSQSTWPFNIWIFEVYFKLVLEWTKRGGADMIPDEEATDSADCPTPNYQTLPTCQGIEQCKKWEAVWNNCGWWSGGGQILNRENYCLSAPDEFPWSDNKSVYVPDGQPAAVCAQVPGDCALTSDEIRMAECRALDQQQEQCFVQCFYERGWDFEYVCQHYPDPNPPKTCYYAANCGIYAVYDPRRAACLNYPACEAECVAERGKHIDPAAECRSSFPTLCFAPSSACPMPPAPNPAPADFDWGTYNAQVASCNNYNGCLNQCRAERGPATTAAQCATLPPAPNGPTYKKCTPPAECRPIIYPPEALEETDAGKALHAQIDAECKQKETDYTTCLNTCFSERGLPGVSDQATIECRQIVSPAYLQCREEVRDKYLKCMEQRAEIQKINDDMEKEYLACLAGGGGGTAKSSKFHWVPIDTANMLFNFGFGLKIKIPIIGKITLIPPFDTPLNAPLSWAGARAGVNDYKIDSTDLGDFGEKDPANPNAGLAYDWAKSQWVKTGQLLGGKIKNPIGTYDGLQKYLGLKDITYTGNTSPAVMVELKKGTDKAVSRSGAGTGVGRFDLKTDTPAKMFAASKAELYFDRSMYPRDDGLTEHANEFSPFWQARLAPLGTTQLFGTNIDESMALYFMRGMIKADF